MQRITPGPSFPLHDVAATRALEIASALRGELMARAGLAVARLCLARFPHAHKLWVACGPGNNGGDGWVAAQHLSQWGKQVTITWLGSPDACPEDSRLAYQRAIDAGLTVSPTPPNDWDVCIDALLGIGGASRPMGGPLLDATQRINAARRPVLAVDVPSGLHADTGMPSTDVSGAACVVNATATLSLLTLKPGLFTAAGRDAAGEVWWEDLGVSGEPVWHHHTPCATLGAAPQHTPPSHASHKGSRGDVVVVGGAHGMEGAAALAATAALRAGAGRVYLHALSGRASASTPADVMVRSTNPADWARSTVVCGCGGGEAVAELLPQVLQHAGRLVLDADALNALARDERLIPLLHGRAQHQRPTVLTPHPLEAARLIGGDAATVQANRLTSAARLADDLHGVVVLKGSGTVIASPPDVPRTCPVINPTGNGRLATAGTGDVLAGLIGGLWAQARATWPDAHQAACAGAYQHGRLADQWPAHHALTATDLATAITG